MSKEQDERMHGMYGTTEAGEHEMKQQELDMLEPAMREREREAAMRAQDVPQHAAPTPRSSQDAAQTLTALFAPDVAQDFRTRWDAIQIGFVDDPRQAVQKADELVEQVMRSLTQTFTRHRTSIEAGVRESEQASTESLRKALRDYRSFFERLLSL